MKLETIRRSFQRAYDDRGVFEPDEKFWRAVKQVIDSLQDKRSKPRKDK